MFLNYDEQAIIKMYTFKSKGELKEKLNNSLKIIEDEDMKTIIKNLIRKIDNVSLEILSNVNNIYE